MQKKLFLRAARIVALAASRMLALCFLAWAAFYLLTTLCAIANFGWRQPMFDQWRMYNTFLTLPFPSNALQLENGHRPIIPNLIRLAEIHWFGANQLLQISIGTCCALLTAGVTALVIWRNRELSVVVRAAGVLIAVLGVFWLANARMLLHGHESLHAYLVTLMVVSAGLCTWQAHHNNSSLWLWLGSAACVVATFSFGPGIATFATVIALILLLRMPIRWLLIPAGILAACLVLYVFVLPGTHGVRNMLHLQPLANVQTAAQWLSSPWAHAWLGLSNSPLEAWLPTSVQGTALGRLLLASANDLEGATGMAWQSLTVVLGVAGIVVFLARVAVLYLRRAPLTQVQVLAIGLCLFALATAAIIGIGRLDYLQAHPSQIYATRYLLWPCLFWTGLVLLLLIDVSRSKNRFVIALGSIFMLALPMILLPTQHAWAGWSAAVHRQSQQAAASARSGVFDAGMFPDDPDASRTDVLQALALMKEDRLAMFADPSWRLLGTYWKGVLRRNDDYEVSAHLLDSFRDTQSGLIAGHFEGAVSYGIAALRRQGHLVVLDGDNAIVGLAEFSFIAPDADSLRVDMPRKRGFDGYIRNYDSAKTYRLALLDTTNGSATVLAMLSAHDR